MSEEIVIHEDAEVKITNLRAVLGGKTYSIANITSVGAKEESPSGCVPAGLIIFGLFLLFIGMSDLRSNLGYLITGVVLSGLGFLAARSAKPDFILQIATAAGEVKALSSKDKAYIQKITDALNDAIIKKG